MSIHGYVIRPLVPLLFRKPKPFEVGGIAETYKVPLPFTTAGLLASKAYHDELIQPTGSYEENIEKALEALGIRLIRGPLPALIKGNLVLRDIYLPTPQDLFICNNPRCSICFEGRLEELKREPNGIKTIPSVCPECGDSAKPLASEVPFLPADSDITKKYISGCLEKSFGRKEEIVDSLKKLAKPFKEAFKSKSRPGVFIERETKSVRAGFFYRAERVEYLEEMEADTTISAGYYLDVVGRDIKLPKYTIASLGGERGVVEFSEHREWQTLDRYYKDLLNISLNEVLERIAESRIFKLWLLTPSILLTVDGKCTWNPETSKIGSFKTRLSLRFNVEIEGAVVGKSIRVSGWDYAKNRVKKMYIAVPPGSIYYFRVDKIEINDARMLIESLILKQNLSDESFLYRIGFGTVIICVGGEVV